MGQIINLNTWEEGLPDALTQTGRGGFLSHGYLAEQPATELLDADEALQYLLTNRKRGITVDGTESAQQFKPDSNYRTVVVVTDRRLLALVGRDSGDEQFSVSLSGISEIETTTSRRTGQLTVTHSDETVWHIHTDTNGLGGVETYLRDASQAWRDVENHLQTVESTLSSATDHRRVGDYDTALSMARSTQTDIEDARSRAIQFSTDHPGNALHDRSQRFESRRRAVIGAIHVDRARGAAETGRELCTEGNYEAAREAYERAREEYDSGLTVAEAELENVDTVREEYSRLKQFLSQLRDSPLLKARKAQQEAVATDDAEVATDCWKTVLDEYQAALDADGDASPISGDPEQIRDRMETVAKKLTGAQRNVATEAMQAGDWYTDAGQHDAAREEYERATEAITTAISTAREWYPDSIEHLQTERDALAQRIERSDAALNGDEYIEDRIQTDDEVPDAFEDIDDTAVIEDPIEPPKLATSPPVEGAESMLSRLASLDQAAFVAVVADALGETALSVRNASRHTPFDLFAWREGERIGVIVRTIGQGPVTDTVISHCAEISGAAGTDSVLVVTTDTVPQSVETAAERRGVYLLCSDNLLDIIDMANVQLPAPSH